MIEDREDKTCRDNKSCSEKLSTQSDKDPRIFEEVLEN